VVARKRCHRMGTAAAAAAVVPQRVDEAASKTQRAKSAPRFGRIRSKATGKGDCSEWRTQAGRVEAVSDSPPSRERVGQRAETGLHARVSVHEALARVQYQTRPSVVAPPEFHSSIRLARSKSF